MSRRVRRLIGRAIGENVSPYICWFVLSHMQLSLICSLLRTHISYQTTSMLVPLFSFLLRGTKFTFDDHRKSERKVLSNPAREVEGMGEERGNHNLNSRNCAPLLGTPMKGGGRSRLSHPDQHLLGSFLYT